MTEPSDLPSVVQAVNQVARDIGPIAKSDHNQQQGFSYRGIETILERIGPKMLAAGVIWLPNVTDITLEDVETRNGAMWCRATVTVRYEIIGPRGDSITATSVGQGYDGGDKATNKAMAGAFKYALLQVLQISTGHDDSDADPTPQEAVAHSRAHGPTVRVTADDERRVAISDTLNEIPDEQARTSAKVAFANKWGLPSELADDRLDDALADAFAFAAEATVQGGA